MGLRPPHDGGGGGGRLRADDRRGRPALGRAGDRLAPLLDGARRTRSAPSWTPSGRSCGRSPFRWTTATRAVDPHVAVARRRPTTRSPGGARSWSTRAGRTVAGRGALLTRVSGGGFAVGGSRSRRRYDLVGIDPRFFGPVRRWTAAGRPSSSCNVRPRARSGVLRRESDSGAGARRAMRPGGRRSCRSRRRATSRVTSTPSAPRSVRTGSPTSAGRGVATWARSTCRCSRSERTGSCSTARSGPMPPGPG